MVQRYDKLLTVKNFGSYGLLLSTFFQKLMLLEDCGDSQKPEFQSEPILNYSLDT